MADPLYVVCDAIDADLQLPASEKARQKANLKAAGIRDAILAAWTFPKTWNFSKSGHAYIVTIASVTVRNVTVEDGSRDLVSIQGSATRDGVILKNAVGTPLFPIEIYNVPCLIADGTGPISRNGRLCTYDLVALLQGILTGVVGAL